MNKREAYSISLIRIIPLGQPEAGRPYLPKRSYSTRISMNYLRKRIWLDLIAICEDQTHPSFEQYGAKGTVVAREWRNHFKYFNTDLLGIQTVPQGAVLVLEPRETRFAYGTCRWSEVQDEATVRMNALLPDFLKGKI